MHSLHTRVHSIVRKKITVSCTYLVTGQEVYTVSLSFLVFKYWVNCIHEIVYTVHA